LVENCSDSDIKVCFNDEDCDINVNYLAGRIEKNTKVVYFDEGDTTLMYAGIFSSQEVYECQLIRIMRRVKELSLLYIDKELISKKEGAIESNFAGDLKQLSELAGNLNSSKEIEIVKSQADNLYNKNENAIWSLW
jgi:hypothetical protein